MIDQKVMDKVEARMLLLYLLKYFNRVCETAHIPCYASAGTLLGAIRHQGFIPWDDDIDFMIPRKYYNAFVASCDAILKEPVIIQTRENDPNAVIEYIKLGFRDDIKGFSDISIDVFFMDETDPSRILFRAFQNRVKTDLYFLKLYKVARQSCTPYIPNNALKRIYLIILSVLPLRIIDKWDKSILTAEKHITNFWVNWGSCYSYKKATYDKSWFGVPRKLPFENTYVWAAQQPEKILTHLYGPDFMTPLPPEKRADHGIGILHCKALDMDDVMHESK